jgi:hypothetical protein
LLHCYSVKQNYNLITFTKNKKLTQIIQVSYDNFSTVNQYLLNGDTEAMEMK